MTRKTLLDKVLVLATIAHSGQFDKGGEPYILHPITVMQYLNTDDEELQCIALLHDVLEDTNVQISDMQNIGCTTRITNAVIALTKAPGQTYEDYKNIVFANKDAMVVKLADLRHNTDIRRLKGISQKDHDRTARYNKFYFEIQNKLRAQINA